MISTPHRSPLARASPPPPRRARRPIRVVALVVPVVVRVAVFIARDASRPPSFRAFASSEKRLDARAFVASVASPSPAPRRSTRRAIGIRVERSDADRSTRERIDLRV
jgi:hypothetical protein